MVDYDWVASGGVRLERLNSLVITLRLAFFRVLWAFTALTILFSMPR